MTPPKEVKTGASNEASWQTYCLAEAIRLREEHWGPLEDADAVRHARQGPHNFADRILLRAQWLGKREGLDTLITRWFHGAAVSLLILSCIAVLIGSGAVVGALGDSTQPVNILWAVGALLGLNTLTFFIWVATLLLNPKKTTGLGRLWLWTTRKLARGPDAALIPQALMNLLSRIGALRWLLGAVSHGLWLIGLSTALVTLLAMLSTASYRFVWATTLLQPDTFVFLTQTIGWLPDQFGFSIPNEDIIRASDNSQPLPPSAQAQWSIWLIGIVVTYGLLPRLVAGLWCVAKTKHARRQLQEIDRLPAYVALRDRLIPKAQTSGIDRPVDPLFEPKIRSEDSSTPAAVSPLSSQPILVSLELAHDSAWPPSSITDSIFNAGNLDSREQRNRLQEVLSHHQTPRLLIVCDARQTPDRGTLHLIASLTHQANQTKVWLYTPEGTGTEGNRIQTWQERLSATGMATSSILQATDQPLRWLETGDE